MQIRSSGNAGARTILLYLHMAHVCTLVYSPMCSYQGWEVTNPILWDYSHLKKIDYLTCLKARYFFDRF